MGVWRIRAAQGSIALVCALACAASATHALAHSGQAEVILLPTEALKWEAEQLYVELTMIARRLVLQRFPSAEDSARLGKVFEAERKRFVRFYANLPSEPLEAEAVFRGNLRVLRAQREVLERKGVPPFKEIEPLILVVDGIPQGAGYASNDTTDVLYNEMQQALKSAIAINYKTLQQRKREEGERKADAPYSIAVGRVIQEVSHLARLALSEVQNLHRSKRIQDALGGHSPLQVYQHLYEGRCHTLLAASEDEDGLKK